MPRVRTADATRPSAPRRPHHPRRLWRNEPPDEPADHPRSMQHAERRTRNQREQDPAERIEAMVTTPTPTPLPGGSRLHGAPNRPDTPAMFVSPRGEKRAMSSWCDLLPDGRPVAIPARHKRHGRGCCVRPGRRSRRLAVLLGLLQQSHGRGRGRGQPAVVRRLHRQGTPRARKRLRTSNARP